MQGPEICKANAVKELLVTHDVLLQNQWNNMAVDVFFALCYLGVKEFLTSLRNCSTESLKPRLFHATDFRVIPFSYTLAKFTTLKCSSLINTALFNTTPKAPKYLSFDSMPKKQFCRCSLYVDVSNYTTSLPTPRRYHREEKSLLPVTRQSIVFKTKQGLLFTNLFQVLVNHWMTVCLSTNLKF